LHHCKLWNTTCRLKLICSDTAHWTAILVSGLAQ
jgi:hypothetical protein